MSVIGQEAELGHAFSGEVPSDHRLDFDDFWDGDFTLGRGWGRGELFLAFGAAIPAADLTRGLLRSHFKEQLFTPVEDRHTLFCGEFRKAYFREPLLTKDCLNYQSSDCPPLVFFESPIPLNNLHRIDHLKLLRLLKYLYPRVLILQLIHILLMNIMHHIPIRLRRAPTSPRRQHHVLLTIVIRFSY